MYKAGDGLCLSLYAFKGSMSTQIDRTTKANIDRMDERKMNRVQRVQELPARGGIGDWVVMCEEVEGVMHEVSYAWLGGRWTRLASVPAE